MGSVVYITGLAVIIFGFCVICCSFIKMTHTVQGLKKTQRHYCCIFMYLCLSVHVCDEFVLNNAERNDYI